MRSDLRLPKHRVVISIGYVSDRPRARRPNGAIGELGAGGWEGIQERIDIQAFSQFWVTEVLIAHWDGYSGDLNNFYCMCAPKPVACTSSRRELLLRST